MSKDLYDLKSFVESNVGRSVSGLDYLHSIYKVCGLPSDFIVCFAKFFWPDFKVVDGLVYISDLFDFDRHQALISAGKSSFETQFWMNLLEITGLFDDLSVDDAVSVAEVVALSWNSKMLSEFGVVEVFARAVRDDELDEVFVVIGSAK